MNIRKIMSCLASVLRTSVFIVLESMLKKHKNYWCFCAWDRHYHTLDNPRAVFEHVKNDAGIKKIILLKEDSRQHALDGENVVFVDPDTLLGVYFVARSKVIMLAYSLGGLCEYSDHISTRHSIIQLWHGIPLKKIGKLFPGENFWDKETSKYSAVICSSDRDKEIMAAAFSPIDQDNVWLTGLPRNDIISMDESSLPADYKENLEHLKGCIAGRRFILYAPTWRYDSKDIYEFSDDELSKLGVVLSKHDAVLGIRGHSNVNLLSAYTKSHQSDSVISANDYPDVNVLLRLTDMLITDYSSIYIDYLITSRPVIHFAYDLERYKGERGFLYEFNDAFAGPVATDFETLYCQLSKFLETESGCVDPRNKRAAELFHSHKPDSGQSVAARITGLINTE